MQFPQYEMNNGACCPRSKSLLNTFFSRACAHIPMGMVHSRNSSILFIIISFLIQFFRSIPKIKGTECSVAFGYLLLCQSRMLGHRSNIRYELIIYTASVNYRIASRHISCPKRQLLKQSELFFCEYYFQLQAFFFSEVSFFSLLQASNPDVSNFRPRLLLLANTISSQ